MAGDLTEIGAGQLGQGEAALVGAWILSMDEAFYRAFALADAQVRDVLQALLTDPESEFGPARYFRSGGELIGFFSAFPSADIFKRRTVLTRRLLALATPQRVDRNAIKENSAASGHLAPECPVYLAKLFVSPDHQGHGYGQRLMERLREIAGPQGIWLHVHNENTGARAFYRRIGFHEHLTPGSKYLTMSCIPA